MPRMTLAKRQRLWHKAIIALINSPTIAAAARALTIHESTLENWMRDPEFMEQFHIAQQTALGHGLAMIEGTFAENVEVLRELSKDKTVQPATRAAAAGKLIDIAIGISKQRSNATYVKQLEEELNRLNSAIIEEEEGDHQARAPQRQRQLPPAGATFRDDDDGGPDDESDAEGEEGAGGNGKARRTNRRARSGE